MSNTRFTPSLAELGWDTLFNSRFESLAIPGAIPARVSSESKSSYQVYSQEGELTARLAGRLRYQPDLDIQYPVVGDWVVLGSHPGGSEGTIQAVLPRKSKFSRKVAGKRTAEQVVAANVDTVFIVSGLDGGRSLNLRRIERYLTLALNSGARPILVLNKMDLCQDLDACIQSVEAIAQGLPVHPVSALEERGLGALHEYLGRGKTAALLGSSGVGKSALINALLGEARQATGAVHPTDHQGHHTTTRRELILLPGGGLVIDTPGMREIQMWAGEDDLADTFADIAALAAGCRFRDCSHQDEPGCKVTEAVSDGTLDSARLASYGKLRNELNFLAAREELGARQQEKAKWKNIAQQIKEIKKQAD